MMRQLSDPVCLRLKPQRDRNKLWNKTHTEPAAPQRPNPNSTFITLRPNCCGLVTLWLLKYCRVMFLTVGCVQPCLAVPHIRAGLLDRGENEGRSYWGGKYKNVEKCLKSQIHKPESKGGRKWSSGRKTDERKKRRRREREEKTPDVHWMWTDFWKQRIFKQSDTKSTC